MILKGSYTPAKAGKMCRYCLGDIDNGTIPAKAGNCNLKNSAVRRETGDGNVVAIGLSV